MHGTLYGKVVAKEDIPFPGGQDAALLSKATMVGEKQPGLGPKNGQSRGLAAGNKKHINREFFQGHPAPVVFVCHIENGTDMVTVDENCHIFIWKYNSNYLDEDGYF